MYSRGPKVETPKVETFFNISRNSCGPKVETFLNDEKKIFYLGTK